MQQDAETGAAMVPGMHGLRDPHRSRVTPVAPPIPSLIREVTRNQERIATLCSEITGRIEAVREMTESSASPQKAITPMPAGKSPLAQELASLALSQSYLIERLEDTLQRIEL